MAFFRPLELVRVALVIPRVRAAVLQTMQDFEDATGMKTYVPEDGGYRTKTRQAAIYADSLAEGFRAAPPDNDKHVWGGAIDLHIEGHEAMTPDNDALYELLATKGEANGLKAGKHFKSGLPDWYHFEDPASVADLEAEWTSTVGRSLWRWGIIATIAVLLAVVVAGQRKLHRR